MLHAVVRDGVHRSLNIAGVVLVIENAQQRTVWNAECLRHYSLRSEIPLQQVLGKGEDYLIFHKACAPKECMKIGVTYFQELSIAQILFLLFWRRL